MIDRHRVNHSRVFSPRTDAVIIRGGFCYSDCRLAAGSDHGSHSLPHLYQKVCVCVCVSLMCLRRNIEAVKKTSSSHNQDSCVISCYRYISINHPFDTYFNNYTMTKKGFSSPSPPLFWSLLCTYTAHFF